MEADFCVDNQSDADVLLPPRKRLLAGLKKQSVNRNSKTDFISSISNEIKIRLNNLLRSHLGYPNISVEEIIKASKLEAESAVNIAIAARAKAEEKAAIATKAISAVKSALEMVEIISKEMDCAEINSVKKKNNIKNNDYNTDEELARMLHQAINSSPRILKISLNSDLKSRKEKRLKNMVSECSDVDACSVDEKLDKNADYLEDSVNFGRKKGSLKQKRLSVNICNGMNGKISDEVSTSKNPLVERPNMWKCQDFKASNCAKSSKIMQL